MLHRWSITLSFHHFIYQYFVFHYFFAFILAWKPLTPDCISTVRACNRTVNSFLFLPINPRTHLCRSRTYVLTMAHLFHLSKAQPKKGGKQNERMRKKLREGEGEGEKGKEGK